MTSYTKSREESDRDLILVLIGVGGIVSCSHFKAISHVIGGSINQSGKRIKVKSIESINH